MGTYKDTLVLPSNKMPIHSSLVKNEQQFYDSCNKNNVYDRFLRDGQNTFILHDGPPYANGDIHIGHALNKMLKDFIVKFNYFKGKSVNFIPGWDCHGLPIEQQARKSKPENLRKACREYAFTQVNKQKEQFKKLGVFADWDNPYLTMDYKFEAEILRSLLKLYEKGYVFEQLKPVFWSWAEKTALAEAEVEYLDRTDKTVYLSFPNFEKDIGFLVWTTTPWTLPSNVAVAINPEILYKEVEIINESGESYPLPLLVADNLISKLQSLGIVRTVLGRSCFGKDVESCFGINSVQHPLEEKLVPILMADFVDDKSGTGCVHIAPAHGLEDYELCKKNNMEFKCIIGDDGKFVEGKYKDLNVFDSNFVIVEDLKLNKDKTWSSSKFVKEQEIVHSYPYCWRSNKPVILRATNQWFIDISKFRDVMLKEFEKINFQPEISKQRMQSMLLNRPDWCISRQRSWGVPIAFLKSKDKKESFISSDFINEVANSFENNGCDFWWENDLDEKYSNYEKIYDILDVWYDSGYSWHILNGRKADLYFEGNDQHRGWFQSSLILGSALNNSCPYKKVITHGFVVDSEGKKMSKSKGNVINPIDVVNKYGAEILRFWAASVDYTKEVSISEDNLKRSQEGYRKIRNTFRYVISNLDEREISHCNVEFLPIDNWILKVTKNYFDLIFENLENYEFHHSIQKFSEYINTYLSGIYINSTRDRLYCNSKNDPKRLAVVFVFQKIFEKMIPFVASFFTYCAHEILSYCPEWVDKDVFNLKFNHDFFEKTNDFDDEHWLKLLNKFNSEFDKLKIKGIAKDTLEVAIETDKYFEGIEDWFSVSYVSTFVSNESLVDCGDFRITKSPHNKCERCWKRNASNDICSRCANVLNDNSN